MVVQGDFLLQGTENSKLEERASMQAACTKRVDAPSSTNEAETGENGDDEVKGVEGQGKKRAPRSRKKKKASQYDEWDEDVSYRGGQVERNNGGRKRRKGLTAEEVLPNASLFVGYVEDGETIEMIMKKFEKLDEIQKKRESSKKEDEAEHNGLDEETLVEVFKETSAFTVQSATRDNELDFEQTFDDGWEWGDVMTATKEDGEMLFLIGDGTDDDLWEEVFGGRKSKKKSKSSLLSKGPKAKARPSSGAGRISDSTGVTQIAFVSDMHGRFVTGLKKVRKVNPNAIVYQRIPNEISRSWAKTIEPYRPKSAVHTNTKWRPNAITCPEESFERTSQIPEDSDNHKMGSILAEDWYSQVKPRAPFEGIVLSPPWKNARMSLREEGESNPNNQKLIGIEPEDLSALHLEREELLPSGFVYIWTPKHLILRVLRVMEKMDLHYVENAVYVKQKVRNTLWHEPSRYFRQSKETLLILRRGKKHPASGKITWSRVEIRHQRTSDVHFDFLKLDKEDAGQGVHLMPHEYVHNMAETMLPLGRFNPLPATDQFQQGADQDGIAPSEGGDEEVASAEATASSSSAAEVENKGKLLHLWAPLVVQRTGWVLVSEDVRSLAEHSK